MEIDVFYQNDDMSFGFDGMSKLDKDAFAFAKKAQYGFQDVDYSYADGTPNTSWGSREQDAYKWRFGEWKPSYKNNCEMLEKYIANCKKQIKTDEDDMLTATSDRKRVLSDYIKGSKYALAEFEGYYEKAQCSLIKTKQEEESFANQLSLAKGNSTTATIILVSSIVILVGVVGFLAYRKFNK
jgi:hypothetical protein